MNNSINITAIMADIKKIAKNIPDFENVRYSEKAGAVVPENPDEAISEMRAYSYVRSYRQLTGKKCEVFLKKVVRKMIKFYVEPIVDGQNDFNASAETTITSLRNVQKKLIRRIEKMETENSRLVKRIEKLEEENNRLIKDLYGE